MAEMKVLVAFATKGGSTREIATAVAVSIKEAGIAVDVLDVGNVRSVTEYEIVVIGSAVYTGNWMRSAVKFLRRFAGDLAGREVWLFDSGPLDESADRSVLPLPSRVEQLAQKIGIVGHTTFGGKLDASSEGFVARAMVRNGKGGDFRDWDRITSWAREIVEHEKWLTGDIRHPNPKWLRSLVDGRAP